MTAPHRKPKFTTYCRMTCIGGSERGECPCVRPLDCEMQSSPYYEDARREAIERVLRLVGADGSAA